MGLIKKIFAREFPCWLLKTGLKKAPQIGNIKTT